MARKRKKSNSLNQVLSAAIESAVTRFMDKQKIKALDSLSELEKSIRNMEKRLSRMGKVKRIRKPRKKSKAVRKAKAGKEAKVQKICRIKGCNEPRKAKGLCNKHYVAKMRKKK
jgi:1-deoxy-D-xylulose 5-phosphate reductoisomerase